MSKFAISVGILALGLALPAAAQVRAVDTAKSKLAFVYTVEKTIAVEGRFPKYTAQVRFDEKQPEKGSVVLDIDLGAIDTGSADGDTEAKRPLWFDVPKFPKATFVSTAIKKVGEGRFEATGKLTIKGKVRDAVAPFTAAPTAGGGLTATGKLVIKRLLFDIGTGQWADVTQVADDVEVRFTLVLGPVK